jgi:hypothetical protein
LSLTNCDTHDNWPPEAFKPFVDMVKPGGLGDTLNVMLADKTIFRLPGALGPVRHSKPKGGATDRPRRKRCSKARTIGSGK